MIISASRRTDIPSFYADWFIKRIREGYVYVRNPMNYNAVSKISLLQEDVDFIVFWTKDPKDILNKLSQLNNYKYYFQFTLNAYNEHIEKTVSSQSDRIQRFIKLSEQIGADKVIWRYDPIMLFGDITEHYHFAHFDKLAKSLCKYTKKCVISFVDIYKKNITNMRSLGCNELNYEAMYNVTKVLSEIAAAYGLIIETCAEKNTFTDLGVNSGKCIDDELISEVCNKKVCVDKDKTQRDECGCVTSVDIGSYNTCPHSCIYCYANYSEKALLANCEKHNKNSPLICGNVSNDDKITVRKSQSIFSCQAELF